MLSTLARRLLGTLVTMFVASILIFGVAEAVPLSAVRVILGAYVTPEQEASFFKQLGLDRPLHVRYLAWVFGTDWQMRRLVGMPLREVRTVGGRYTEWWAEEEPGVLIRWNFDGDNLFAIRRYPDGKQVVSEDNDRWQVGADGVSRFWGVDQYDRVVLWEREADIMIWYRRADVSASRLERGGAVVYVPLQRGIIRGDFGKSIITARPVTDTLWRRLRNSLILAGLAFVATMPLGLLLGILAGLNEGKPLDRFLSLTGLVTVTSPAFAVGIILIVIFARLLKLLPATTLYLNDRDIFAKPQMLILPALTLMLMDLGYILRIVRASVLDVLNKPYVRTARLKGLPYRRIVFRHVLRNALMAPVTVMTLHVNWFLGGAVIVEAIFGFPGLGSFIGGAAGRKDVFVMEAGVMLMAFVAALTQMVADILYVFINPRVRYS
ncbi:MAG: ABC transporter permease [Anaerolineae bacterium]